MGKNKKKKQEAVVEEEVEAEAVEPIAPVAAVAPETGFKELFRSWLDEAPIAQGSLTQRWYGEEFVPSYKRWLERGRKLGE